MRTIVTCVVSIIAIVIAYTLCSCGPALNAGDAIYQKSMEGQGCEPASLKCIGSQLATCQADHTWQVNTDCKKYSPSLACFTLDNEPGCYAPERIEE